MANNCMYLVNTATGQRVLLAKHLATEWYVPHMGEQRLKDAFEAELVEYDAPYGSTAWRIEYEDNEPALDAELAERVARRGKETL